MPNTKPQNKGGTTGTNGTAGTGFDPSKLRALTGSAKVGANDGGASALPFDELDPDAPADRAMNFRTNDYDRALFRYVAGLRGESVQKTLRSLVREAALAAVRR